MDKNIYLEGLDKIDDGKYRIVEKVIIPNNAIEKHKIDDPKITESIKEEFGVSPDIFYTLPIWEMTNKNKNGRSYDKVIETVVSNKEATINLADHPKGNDDGNPKETWAVAKNPRIVEGWMCADFYPVGGIGALAVEIVEKGGPLTISSSCLGNVDNNGNVLQEGFALERYGDWVTNPSNGYKYYKDTNSRTENVTESKKENVTIIKEEDHLGDNSIVQFKEKKIMDERLQEKILESNIQGLIREAKKEESIPSQIKSLENILPYFEDGVASGLKEKVVSDITDLQKQLSEKASKADELTESVQEKDARIVELEEAVKVNEGSVEKAKAIVEEMKSKLSNAQTIMESQESKVLELESVITIQEGTIEDLTSKIKELMEPKDDTSKGKTDIDDEGKDIVVEAKKKEADDEDEEEDSSDSEPDEEKEDGEEEKEEKKKESLSEDEKTKIYEYYKNNRKEYPEITDIRLKVYESGSFEEAKKLIDEKIEESKKDAPVITSLRETILHKDDSNSASAVSIFRKKFN